MRSLSFVSNDYVGFVTISGKIILFDREDNFDVISYFNNEFGINTFGIINMRGINAEIDLGPFVKPQ